MLDELSSKSVEELFDFKNEINSELKKKLYECFESVAKDYVALHGPKAGMEELCDHMFKWVAPKVYPGGWAGLLQYAIKASG
jgi:hypothetical protein